MPENAIQQSYEIDGPIRTVIETLALYLYLIPAGAAVFLLFTKSRYQSILRALRWLRSRNWTEILLVRVVLAYAVTSVFANLYVKFKVNIPTFTDYTWDHFFAEVDRRLFFGHDPWVLSHAIFPGPDFTSLIDKLYIVWFLEMQLAALAIALLPLRNPVRLTYLLAFGLSAGLCGNLLAILFPAVGPVYLEPLTGDPMFAPLMDLLNRQSAELHLQALSLHQLGWEGYANPDANPLGISAFPSVHVQMATIFALAGFAANRYLGWIATLYAAAVMIGSVHLAWHYAIDGIAGIALAFLIWKFSWAVTTWWLAQTEPAAAIAADSALETPIPVPVPGSPGYLGEDQEAR
ncbi:MAG TPA: phosphatase PAP2 family protein [Thermohalobaculum sp.]|nr:phosphatase PAP2 family protein [Thermohalobaculum sp.]